MVAMVWPISTNGSGVGSVSIGAPCVCLTSIYRVSIMGKANNHSKGEPMAPPKQQTTLAAALAAAQSKMDNVLKNKKNPHFKSDYADLSAVRDVVIPALNEQGIAVVAHIDGDVGFCTIRTVILFGSEAMEIGSKTVKVGGRSECQETLSASSYIRRGHLAALGGIAQADDDGESTVHQQRTETRPQAPRQAPRQAPMVQGPAAKPGAVPCPKCQSETVDNFAYREWMKSNPNAKKKAAYACRMWQKCGWTIWPRAEATAFLSDSAIASKPKTATDENPALFDDDISKT
jgi:hypothetical protein